MTGPRAPGRVERYLLDCIAGGPIHFTLIDPDKSPGNAAGRIARGAVEQGSHAILLGGSTGISPEKMGEAARAVKAVVQVPAIIFPEGPGSLAREADAVLFMSLLNSRRLDLVVRAHAKAAPVVRRLGLEPIPLGYLVIEPGMRVGEVGEVDVVWRSDPDTAVGYALAAEYLGMRFVYLEAGSGAPTPVPAPIVRAVREAASVPILAGGGIRTADDARLLLEAGASALVTGTITEEEGLGSGFRGILQEVRRARGGH
ncbi:MAG: geranylgeranylglyceryl/heptaprenylglyceryl phosphate synthase [Thermoplasmata archaeon]|nr:geranylgeranylglyceryl/heptaprenylglyceryl phosphate synthase [Thermoplasmata archaeon]